MRPSINLEKEYGIVLEGGGAKGAYQVGAWRALREAGVKIKGISGTSVGALNAVMMCMDDLEKAEEIWETMDYSRVLGMDSRGIDLLKNLDLKSLNFTELAAEVKKTVKDGGLNIDPLKELIAETVDEEKVRTSPRECFVTTFSVTDRKEVNFDLKQASAGEMKDMLLASSYFPGFKNERLFGKIYMDGGCVNNVPANVLTDRGYKDIIQIRIYGIGVDREKLFKLPEDVTVYEIAPRRNLGGILEFNGKKAKRNMELGYFDAMRLLYDLKGRKYYIEMPDTEEAYFQKLMSERELLRRYLLPNADLEESGRLSGYRVYTEKIFPHLAKKLKLGSDWDYKDLYGAFLELCARKMNLEVLKIYSVDDIIEMVQKECNNQEK